MSLKQENGHLLFLNFHGLGKPPLAVPVGEQKYWIEPRLFADVLDRVNGREDVKITIDDANESDYTIALPLLCERKLKARFFVVAGRIDQKGYLCGRQIMDLCAEGMLIGNHGMWHSRWLGMSQPKLEEELITAREMIQQIAAVPIMEAACPFGSYDRGVLQMLRKQGYRRVFTSDGGAASTAAWMQPRNTIQRSHRFDEIVNLIDAPSSGPDRLWRDLKIAIKSRL